MPNKATELKLMDFKLNQSVLIEASAGTGKTFTITNLVLRILLGLGAEGKTLERPLSIDDLLIVTFTNAATADLRKRIFERIHLTKVCISTFLENLEGLELSQMKRGALKKYIQSLVPEADEIIVAFIQELFVRSPKALRQAVLVLTRAERSIDDAAICTIHSFCNRALNQVFAFEAGACFNMALTNDLSEEEKEAFYTVWRRLFYKKAADHGLLDMLGENEPLKLKSARAYLNQVRLSDPHQGVVGYQLTHFDTSGLKLKSTSDIEKMVHKAFSLYEVQTKARLALSLRSLSSFIEKYSFEEFQKYFDPQTEKCGVYMEQAGKSSSFTKGPTQLLRALAECYKGFQFFSEKCAPALKTILASQEVPQHTKDPVMGALEKLRKYSPEMCASLEGNFKIVAKAKRMTSLIGARSHYKNDNALKLQEDFLNSIFDFVNELKHAAKASLAFIPLIRTLFLILVDRQLDSQCHDHRIMGNDEVLRRLDYALNSRDEEAGERLAEMIRNRYPLAMIDEFQDTDPVQYNIFSKLYLNKPAFEKHFYCYLIGDPKQAIYAFRGSDINSYIKASGKTEGLSGVRCFTLATNYRSAPDIVHGYNAMFGTDLNKRNTDPFDETRISYKAVTAYSESQEEREQFFIDDFQDYLDKGSESTLASQGIHRQILGNTYVVNTSPVGEDQYSSKAQMTEDIAKITASLVAKVIKHGKIRDVHGNVRAVRPGDITILVRSGTENELIQKALWAIDRPSVYFSDKSSVLMTVEDNQEMMSAESRELLYLMEAMTDCTSRPKIMRVLGSTMLSLTTEQFLERLKERNFEKEVQCLRDSYALWQKVGFQSAFEYWADDPLHEMSIKLLQQRNGERALTNYRHLSEIMQSAHEQQGGIQAQIHWFYELVSGIKSLPNAEETQKRLESEKDQIKIMTIHKSKGLEFPVVFMPFLWNWNKDRASIDTFLNAVVYYNKEVEHKALDFAPDSADEMSPFSPAELALQAEEREQTRLLYVALTRARYANFIFCGSTKVRSDMRPSALIRMLRSTEDENSLDTKKNFLEAVTQRYQDFTVVDGPFCVERFNFLCRNVEQEEVAPSAQEQLFQAQDKYQRAVQQKLEKRSPEHAPAVSFVYKDAVDMHFSVISYSSLTQGVQSIDRDDVDDEVKTQKLPDFSAQGIMQSPQERKSITNVYDEPAAEQRAPVTTLEMLLEEPERSISWYMQRLWESGLAVFSGALHGDTLYQRRPPLRTLFPRGTMPGTFLHECLQEVVFSNIKYENYKVVLGERLMNKFHSDVSYLSLMHKLNFSMEEMDEDLADWFNDIVEAPLIHGRHHCLALADLAKKSWCSEMEFTMANDFLDTKKLDELCQDVARDLLPEDMQFIIPSLVLKPKQVEGFITGSIDVACRFDLNTHIDIMNRFDLKKLLPVACLHKVEEINPYLDQKVYRDTMEEIKNMYDLSVIEDPMDRKLAAIEMHQEMDALRKHRQHLLGIERDDIDLQGPMLRYYVIDYKSNDLGAESDSYGPHKMLEAIYEHRYDVQFLIYTLALYRFLKQRMLVSEDASYEELEQFYEENIGGAAYLFLRGMRADYMRQHISPGVFFTHLDFSYIYRLEQILQA